MSLAHPVRSVVLDGSDLLINARLSAGLSSTGSPALRSFAHPTNIAIQKAPVHAQVRIGHARFKARFVPLIAVTATFDPRLNSERGIILESLRLLDKAGVDSSVHTFIV